jgi:hypothetical protein
MLSFCCDPRPTPGGHLMSACLVSWIRLRENDRESDLDLPVLGRRAQLRFLDFPPDILSRPAFDRFFLFFPLRPSAPRRPSCGTLCFLNIRLDLALDRGLVIFLDRLVGHARMQVVSRLSDRTSDPGQLGVQILDLVQRVLAGL